MGVRFSLGALKVKIPEETYFFSIRQIPLVTKKRYTKRSNPLNCKAMFSKTCVSAPWTPTVARVFLALLFVVSGIGKVMAFDATVGYVGSLTNESVAGFLTILAILFELGGGALLLLNWKVSLAIDMLIAFTVVATILGHTTFTGDSTNDKMQYIQILKNLAIVGGLLLMGRFACHRKTHQEEMPELP